MVVVVMMGVGLTWGFKSFFFFPLKGTNKKFSRL